MKEEKNVNYHWAQKLKLVGFTMASENSEVRLTIGSISSSIVYFSYAQDGHRSVDALLMSVKEK